ncbi:MAG: hypothetical protein C0501_29970, partial [Isosphaera sp.]|nr:hypothetical protein [Isosphaera sp.]
MDEDEFGGTKANAFTLTRSGDLSGELTVSYSVGGSATAGSDYTTLSGTATFAAGSATRTVAVSPVDDSVAEPTETIVLTVLSGTGYTVGATGTATLNLFDNETPVVSISATNTGEGTATGGFTFTRIGDLSGALAVTYTVSGTATATTDYTALSGTANFTAGSDRVEVRVEAIGDNTVDDGETVIATLTGAGSSYTIDSSAGAATVVIADQALTVSVERLSDGEEGVGGGTFRFTRSGDISAELTITYTVTGTATSGSDFTALSGSVTFLAGSAQTDVPVSVTDDATVEQTETVVVTIPESSSYQLGNASDALFIRDNDTRRVYWNSTSSTDWTVGANWSTGTVPLDTDDVYISGSNRASITNLGSGLTSLAGLHFLNGYAGTATLANALSVGTFEMTTGTLDQPSARNLTVTSALLWSGGTLNATDSGAVVNVSGAAGVIDPPDTGSMAIASTLNVLNGAAVTLLGGTLHFIGGSGFYIAQQGKVTAYVANSNTDVATTGGSTETMFHVETTGSLRVTKKDNGYTGGVDFSVPILNRGTFTVVDGIHFTVKGHVNGEASRPSIEHHSGTWLVGSGSNFVTEFGVKMSGGEFSVKAEKANPVAGIKGDFTLAGGSIFFLGGSTGYAHLVVDGKMTWSGGAWLPSVDRVGYPVGHANHGLPEADQLIVKGAMKVTGGSLSPQIPNFNVTTGKNTWTILSAESIDGAPPALAPALF